MGYYADSLVLQCDVGGPGCKKITTFKNDDQLSYSMLMRLAEEKGWYVPSGGKTLCPNCMVITEAKYQAKLRQKPMGSTEPHPHLKGLYQLPDKTSESAEEEPLFPSAVSPSPEEKKPPPEGGADL